MTKKLDLNNLEVMDFLNYLLYDLNCYRKEKVVFSLVIFVAVITQIICLQIGGGVSYFIFFMLLSLLCLFVSFGVMYLASHFGFPFRKKQTSIQFMMLPVSQGVKFWVRFINQAVVPTLLVILSIAAAIGVAFLVHIFVDVKFCSGMQEFLSAAWGKVHGDIPVEIMAIANAVKRFFVYLIVSLVFSVCLMVLGSLVFGRFAILKTYVCSSIISWVTTPLLYSNFDEIIAISRNRSTNYVAPEDAFRQMTDVFNTVFSTRIIIIYIVSAVAMLVISYILFKRKTILRTGI